MKKVIIRLSIIFLFTFLPCVQATVFIQNVDFEAEQSLWGSGSSADFGANGTVDMGLFDFKYDLGASSGTVSSSFRGDLSADYNAQQTDTGFTTLNIAFEGASNGGVLNTDLGAWADFWVPTFLGKNINVLNRNYHLNINEQFTPEIDARVTGSDSFTAGSVGVDVVVAKAGVDFDIEQTASFDVETLDGKLAYQHQDGGDIYTADFSLTSGGATALDVMLGLEGQWDFWFIDEILDNTFETSFDVDIVLFEEHPEGYWDEYCGFLGCVPFWNYRTVRNETTLANVDVYNGSPFALEYEQMSDTASFSIQVGGTPTIPEPATFALMGIGLAGIGYRRRKAI